MRRTVALAVTLAVTLTGSVLARANALDVERAAAIAELAQVSASLHSAEMRTDHLQGSIEIAQQEQSDRAELLALRPGFVAEITALRTALSEAEGKVDTATHRASALSAQQTVIAERKDPNAIVAATATVHALTGKIGEEVSVWESAQYAAPEGPAWADSGPDGYARVRAALDRVGGAGVGLYESSSCAGGTAPACANSNGYIKYRADIANWGSGRLNWAMAHELAHIHQFRVWSTLTSSSGYRSLFNGDPEFLANCMAVVRGFPGSVGCDGDQQAWASGIWVGVVR